MSITNKIAQNTIIHLLGKAVSLTLGLFSIVILTRYLGQEGFGYYSTVVAYLMFFGALIDFGLTLTNIQMVSDPKNDYHKVANNIMSLRLVLSLGYVIFCCGLIWFLPYSLMIKIGAIIAVWAYFSVTITQTLTGFFQEKLQMLKVVIAEVAGKIILIAILLLTVYLHKSIYWTFFAISAEGLATMLIIFLYSRKIVAWRWQVDKQMWKEIISRSWPIALSISFNLIYLRTDTIILSLTRSAGEVGLYGAAYRIVDVLTMLPAVFMGIVLPVMTRNFAEKNFQELKDITQKAFDALVIFAAPIVFGALVVGRPLMQLIAGPDFAVSGDILKILIIASGAIFITSLFGYAVVAVKKQKTMMWGYLTAALFTLIGYLIFIPLYGYWGAAWMTVFSEILVMIFTWVVVYKTIKFSPSLKIFLKTVPASLIMAIVIYYLDWPVYIGIFVGALIYFGLLILVGGIKKQTIVDLITAKR